MLNDIDINRINRANLKTDLHNIIMWASNILYYTGLIDGINIKDKEAIKITEIKKMSKQLEFSWLIKHGVFKLICCNVNSMSLYCFPECKDEYILYSKGNYSWHNLDNIKPTTDIIKDIVMGITGGQFVIDIDVCMMPTHKELSFVSNYNGIWICDDCLSKIDKPQLTKLEYVYLAYMPPYYYKIGYSKTPKLRIANVGTKLPSSLKPIAIISTDNGYALEQQLHQMFSKKRINGEWFNLSEKDIEYIKGL
jgi:hypothetical protein